MLSHRRTWREGSRRVLWVILCTGSLVAACGGRGDGGDGSGGSGGRIATGGSGASGTAGAGGVTASGGTAGSTVTDSGGSRNDAATDAVPSGSGGVTASGGGSAGGANGGGGTTAAGGRGGTAAGGNANGGSKGGSGGATSIAAACAPPTSGGHYQMEDLDRGVVAVKVADGVYVGWRMMGYEYNPTSAASVSYNVYRSGSKIANVTDSTNYLDASGTASSTYTVSAVIDGTECPQSPSSATWAQNYLRIPLSIPATSPSGATYSANDAAPGDLDGDGVYDLVLKWDPSDSKDNSQSGVTSDVFLDGYTLAGKHLWRIDLGPNIRAGAHYTQFSVGDFDGDGKAEVACKTAPGTKDGTGAYLHTGPAANDDDSAKYANSDGYILTGPEYLTVFEGATGKELATVSYPVPRGTVSEWGDKYGNRVDRFNGGLAFVSDTGSGKTATGRPSIIQQRGYYTRMTISAFNFRNNALTKVWTFDSDTAGNGSAAGQGNHQAMAADVNNDGAQEIITGAATIGSDGTLVCTTGKGHGDAMHVSELVKGKGISVFTVHEGGTYGHDCHDAATCSLYIDTPGKSDNGRGVADYVSMNDLTAATCSSGVGTMNCATGATVSSDAGSNFLIYWDADEARELENGTSITKSGGGTLLSATDCASNNGTKSTPTLTADLLGDWREELVLRESDNSALRVYTTTAVTKRRIYTLMHDPTYRAQVSFEQSAYNQPPHVGFHIGAGMADPPKPDIYVK